MACGNASTPKHSAPHQTKTISALHSNNATISDYCSEWNTSILKKLVIFGVGLIGGSVALALKQQQPSLEIIGVGRDAAHLETALHLNIIDAISENLADTLTDADMVLLATPVAQTANILSAIQPHLQANTIITDAGSTKTDVLGCAAECLGKHYERFVGGHPIAGAEKSGASAAFASLYQDKTVVLTPSKETAPDALAAVKQLWQQCGANISEMPANQHDEIFAMVSHLPHLLAFALVNDIATHPQSADLLQFAASGFRDFSRIAGSHPEMWRDISLANREALIKSITQYQTTLTNLKNWINDGNGEALEQTFNQASQVRNNWASKSK